MFGGTLRDSHEPLKGPILLLLVSRDVLFDLGGGDVSRFSVPNEFLELFQLGLFFLVSVAIAIGFIVALTFICNMEIFVG